MKVFIIGSLDAQHPAKLQFDLLSQSLGRQLAQQAVTVIACSPHPNSCDASVLRGIQEVTPNALFCLELHYPRTEQNEDAWQKQLAALNTQVRVRKFGHEILAEVDQAAVSYSWLLSQLRAIEEANYVVLMGGRIGGSSDLLVRLAEAQQKLVLPIPIFDGVGAACFAHRRYQLRDIWGETACDILEQKITGLQVVELLLQHRNQQLAAPLQDHKGSISFFISYSREQPAEADLVETILRRRNHVVLRDDQHFKPSENIPQAIQDRINQATVFIALWGREYACSPWCYDELSIALHNHLTKGKGLWIFSLDTTRMVHPLARDRVTIPASTRPELAAGLLQLLQAWQN